jgi:uncharacterized membrane protein
LTDDTPPSDPASDSSIRQLTRAHLRNGWIGLVVFVCLGIGLESLHAFKSFAYLGVGNETRRLMFTLAHAHGIGLSLVHIAFAATLSLSIDLPGARMGIASRCLNGALLLMPTGFLLGGIVTYSGDPGIGVLLVPVGALLLLIAVLLVAWTLVRTGRS